MPNPLKRIAAISAIAFLLSGCGEPLNGAYQAAIQYGEEEPRVVGLAVILPNRIIADSNSVDVAEWKTEDDLTTAYGAQGERLIQFRMEEDGALIQTLPGSRVIYTKIDL